MGTLIGITKFASMIFFMNISITRGTMNLAPGKSITINDGWNIVFGKLRKAVDNSIHRCVVFEAEPGNDEDLTISVNLQNYTHVYLTDIQSDVQNAFVYLHNTTQGPSDGIKCKIDRECNAIAEIVKFESDVGKRRVEICEIRIFGCPVGFYGDDCLDICRCYGECDPDDGHCNGQCHDGWIGHSCEKECPVGTYGKNCSQICEGNCFGDMPCNPVTGNCQSGCTEGWTGPKCDTSVEMPETSALSTTTLIALGVSAVFILILFLIILICLFRNQSKSSTDGPEQPYRRRRFLRNFGKIKSLFVNRKSQHDKDEGITFNDAMESEYIDLNTEVNKHKPPHSPPKPVDARKSHKPVGEMNYQSLLKNGEITDVHFYEKKNRTDPKQLPSGHKVACPRNHPTSIHVTATNKDVDGNHNNMNSSSRSPTKYISPSSKTHQEHEPDSSNIYLDLLDNNERDIHQYDKKLNNGQQSRQTTCVTGGSVQKRKHYLDQKTGPIYDQPEKPEYNNIKGSGIHQIVKKLSSEQPVHKPTSGVNGRSNQSRKDNLNPKTEPLYTEPVNPEDNQGRGIHQIVKKLNSEKFQNTFPIVTGGSHQIRRNHVNLFNSKSEPVYDQPGNPKDNQEKESPIVKKFNNGLVQVQKTALDARGRSLQNRRNNLNSGTEPVYDQPENHYDYIEVENPLTYKQIYPALVQNGIKLPVMK